MPLTNNDIFGIVTHPKVRFSDQRGWLTELFRADELPSGFIPVMAYVSETLPQMSRGPHEHKEQADYLIFIGPGDLKLYLWDARPVSPTWGIQRPTTLRRTRFPVHANSITP